MPKMRRQIFVHLLFACLLLAASPLNHFTANVQAIQSGQFKFRPVQPSSSKRIHKYVTPQRVEEKKTRKNPSGPNPTGNHRPPSRK